MKRRKQEGREEKGALQHHANLQKKNTFRESLNAQVLHETKTKF